MEEAEETEEMATVEVEEEVEQSRGGRGAHLRQTKAEEQSRGGRGHT